MAITLFYTSLTFSVELKKKQKRVRDILESKKYDLQIVDIAKDPDEKERMRRIASDSSVLPPQIVNGDNYCGGYDEFITALDDECLDEFLKINN